jgi:hypothetical protein
MLRVQANEGIKGMQDKCLRWLRELESNLEELRSMQTLHLRRRDDTDQVGVTIVVANSEYLVVQIRFRTGELKSTQTLFADRMKT